MKKLFISVFSSIFLLALVSFISPSKVSAHCDTLDGPVVQTAQKALEIDDVNYILLWVKPEDEEEIRKAFKKAQDKRKKARTQEEKNKADMELYGTLIRIHREGEGAHYEGVKPAGSIEPEIALADKAVETKNLDEVLNHIQSEQAKEVIRNLFHQLRKKSNYQINDIPAGREFIGLYVKFIHTVEKVVDYAGNFKSQQTY